MDSQNQHEQQDADPKSSPAKALRQSNNFNTGQVPGPSLREEDEGHQIWIGNIPFEMQSDDLWQSLSELRGFKGISGPRSTGEKRHQYAFGT